VPFPFPVDPSYRREIALSWLLDVDDRLDMGDLDGAEKSWKTATDILLSLPAGEGSFSLDEGLFQARVKLDNAHTEHNMRTISEDTANTTSPAKSQTITPCLETFSTKLKDGREIVIREMTGRDLVYMEKELANSGDIERGMKVIERLIVGDVKITYDEILELGVRDFKKLSDLVAKANGEDEGEDPN